MAVCWILLPNSVYEISCGFAVFGNFLHGFSVSNRPLRPPLPACPSDKLLWLKFFLLWVSLSSLVFIVQFLKYPYSPQKGLEFPGEWGAMQGQKIERKVWSLSGISRGVDGLRKNSFCGGGGGDMNIFWNCTLSWHTICSVPCSLAKLLA